jgi:protein-tyrosine phosphatase
MDSDQVTENLFVGSCPTTENDLESLKGKYGISAVLTVQTEDDLDYWGIDWKRFEKIYHELGIEVRRVPVPDFDTEALQRNLPNCVAVLDDLLKHEHSVFLHCTAGVNCSPTIAYL